MIDLLSFALGLLTAAVIMAVMIVIAIVHERRDREADETKSSFMERGK